MRVGSPHFNPFVPTTMAIPHHHHHGRHRHRHRHCRPHSPPLRLTRRISFAFLLSPTPPNGHPSPLTHPKGNPCVLTRPKIPHHRRRRRHRRHPPLIRPKNALGRMGVERAAITPIRVHKREAVVPVAVVVVTILAKTCTTR